MFEVTMHRAKGPVCNKLIAARLREQEDAKLKKSLREMKPLIDAKTPKSVGMAHCKNNWKREEALKQKYEAIDNDNKKMLGAMVKMVNQRDYSLERSFSLPSLRWASNGIAIQEERRIERENAKSQRTIENITPYYSVRTWEEDFRRKNEVLQRICEYPPALLRKRTSAAPSSLSPLPAALTSYEVAMGLRPDVTAAPAEQLRYVFRDHMFVGQSWCLVEIATDGKVLAVSACDAESLLPRELLISEENHRRLLTEVNDYAEVACRLRFDGDNLVLDGPPASPPTCPTAEQAAQLQPEGISSA